jgi:hypothetical protein
MDHPKSAAINPACLDRYLQRLSRQAPVLGACEVVGQMGGLRKFVVTFQPRVAHTDMTEYLYPMVQLTVPMIIIFAGENVCFHGGTRGREWFESLPFHVIRTGPQRR